LKRAPNRTIVDTPATGASLLSHALAQGTRYLPAGDDLGACRHQIFEERATAMAIAANIDKLRHSTLCAKITLLTEPSAIKQRMAATAVPCGG
jgi:hypothetical protein